MGKGSPEILAFKKLFGIGIIKWMKISIKASSLKKTNEKNCWDKVMERDKSPCALQVKRHGRNVLSFPNMLLTSEKNATEMLQTN